VVAAKLPPHRRLGESGGSHWPVLILLPSPVQETHPHHHPTGPTWRWAGNGRRRYRLAELPAGVGTPGPFQPGTTDDRARPPAPARVISRDTDAHRLGLNRLGLNRLGLNRLGLDRLGLDRLGLDRLGLDRLGLDRLGLYRLGLYR
jgi:hypothetical protein